MKNKIIKLFNLLIYPLTFNIFFKRIISNDFIVLLYHDVSDKPSAFHRTENLYVSKKKFKDQILFLKKYYKFINPKNIKRENQPTALVTFDDGAYSYFKNAVPFLTKQKIPSIHFLNISPIINNFFSSAFAVYLVNKGYIKKKKFTDLKYNDFKFYLKDASLCKKVKAFHGKFVTLKYLKKFKNNKYVYFGNHLYNHYNVIKLSKSEIKYYYEKNHKYLKKFKNSINFFSYPFGQKNENYNNSTDKYIINILKSKKIFYADTLSFNKDFAQSIHRMTITNDMDEVGFKKKVIFFKVRNFFLRFNSF